MQEQLHFQISINLLLKYSSIKPRMVTLTFLIKQNHFTKLFFFKPHFLFIINVFLARKLCQVQSNRSIPDMLYNGLLVIADPFQLNRPNQGQTLIEKHLYSGHFYSGKLLQRTQFFCTVCKGQAKCISFYGDNPYFFVRK